MLGRTAEAVARGEAGEGFVVMNIAGLRIQDRLKHDAKVATRDDPLQPLDRLDRLFGQLGERPRRSVQPGCRVLRASESVDDVNDALGDFLGPQDLAVDLEARPLYGKLVRLRPVSRTSATICFFSSPTSIWVPCRSPKRSGATRVARSPSTE